MPPTHFIHVHMYFILLRLFFFRLEEVSEAQCCGTIFPCRHNPQADPQADQKAKTSYMYANRTINWTIKFGYCYCYYIYDYKIMTTILPNPLSSIFLSFGKRCQAWPRSSKPPTHFIPTIRIRILIYRLLEDFNDLKFRWKCSWSFIFFKVSGCT